MRNKAGWLAIVLAALIAMPHIAGAGSDDSKKYSVELQLGGSYALMQDVNDYIPHTRFSGITPETELNLAAQYGLGFAYRHMPDFGWQFGYNHFTFVSNYRTSAYFTSEESWAEQSLTGAEFYALATWYKPLFGLEGFFFGVGPTFNWATLDRSVDVVVTAGSHLTEGGFADAKGKALGLMGAVGLELMVGERSAVTLQVGARSAVIGKLTYKDRQGNEKVVFLDPNITDALPNSSLPKLPVDYTGGFAKLTLRAYFQPSSDWRTPKR